MTGVIEGFRWALIGGIAPHWGGLALGLAITLLMFYFGLGYFHRAERTYVDIV